MVVLFLCARLGHFRSEQINNDDSQSSTPLSAHRNLIENLAKKVLWFPENLCSIQMEAVTDTDNSYESYLILATRFCLLRSPSRNFKCVNLVLRFFRLRGLPWWQSPRVYKSVRGRAIWIWCHRANPYPVILLFAWCKITDQFFTSAGDPDAR